MLNIGAWGGLVTSFNPLILSTESLLTAVCSALFRRNNDLRPVKNKMQLQLNYSPYLLPDTVGYILPLRDVAKLGQCIISREQDLGTDKHRLIYTQSKRQVAR